MSEEIVPTFMDQIRALRKGESLAKVKRIETTSSDADKIGEALAAIKRIVNTSVSRVRKDKPGSNFRVESGTMLTHDHEAVLAVVSVSRL